MNKTKFKFSNITKFIFLLSVLIVLFSNSSVKALKFKDFKGNSAYACLQHGGTFRSGMSFPYTAVVPKYKNVTKKDKNGRYYTTRERDGTQEVTKYAWTEVENVYSSGKSGQITTSPFSPSDERKVAWVLYNHTGWRGSTQCWIWGNIGTVKTVLNRGGKEYKNKTAKTLFLEKIALNTNISTDAVFETNENIETNEDITKISSLTSKLGENDDGEEIEPSEDDEVVGVQYNVLDPEDLADTGSFSEDDMDDGGIRNDVDSNTIKDLDDEDFDSIIPNNGDGTLESNDKVDDIENATTSDKGMVNAEDKKEAINEKEDNDKATGKTKTEVNDYLTETDSAISEVEVQENGQKSTKIQAKNGGYPKLENVGQQLVFSYNDIAGPYIIDWDNTNCSHGFGDVGSSVNAVSKIVKITINYLDGSTAVRDNNSEENKIKILNENGNIIKNMWNITPQKKFYITNPYPDKEITGIDIQVNKKIRIYKVRYTILKAGSIRPTNKNRDWQSISKKPQELVRISRSHEDPTYKNTIHIETYVKKGSIELTKKGIYETKEAEKDDNGNFKLDENGNKIYSEKDEEELLPNVSFKVFYNQAGKYIQDIETVEYKNPKTSYNRMNYDTNKAEGIVITERKKVVLTDDITKAKVYTTDENGVLEIKDLYAGKTKADGSKEGATYTLIEVDGGENSYYIDPLKIENATSDYTLQQSGKKQDAEIKSVHKTINDKQYCAIDNVTAYYDDINKTYYGNEKKVNGSEGRRIKTYIVIKNDRTSGNLLIEKNDETFPKNVKLEGVQFKIKLKESENEGEEDPHDLKQENMWLKSVEDARKTKTNNPSPSRVDNNNPTIKKNLNNNTDDENTDNNTANKQISLDDQDNDKANVYDYSEFLHDEYLTDKEEEAGIFTTSKDGLIKIKCILNGDYEIYEIKSAEGYDIKRQWYYGTDKPTENDQTSERGQWVAYGDETNYYDNWGKDQNGDYYPIRDDHGIVTISTNDNYYKPVYSNRKVVAKISGNIWEDVPIGDKASGTYNSLNYSDSVDHENDQKLSKDAVSKVKLYIRETEEVDGDITRKVSDSGEWLYKCVAETTVDDNGYWEITQKDPIPGEEYDVGKLKLDLNYWELSDGYIEFIYDNQKYICTDVFANVDRDNMSEEEWRQDSINRNSKAQEEMLVEDELDERKLTGTQSEESATRGSAITTKDSIVASEETAQKIINARYDTKADKEDSDETGYYNIHKLGLTGYYNPNPEDPKCYEIENINLGLWLKLDPTYEIQETLEYSKILMNGYTYTYDYNSAGTPTMTENGEVKYTGSGAVPTTNQEIGNNVYGAKIYPSDIAYTAKKGAATDTDGMQMYVVYKITVTDSTTIHVKDIYDETKLYVTSLTNEYDSYKYSIDNESHINDKNWEGSNYFGLWNNVDSKKVEDLYDTYSDYGKVEIDKTTEEKHDYIDENNQKQNGYQLANYDINADKDIQETVIENGKEEVITSRIEGDDGRLNNGVEEGTSNSVYIQFRVNKQFLDDLLSKKVSEENENSCAVSVAHAVAHHTLTRTDNVWYNTETYDLEGNKGKTTQIPEKNYADEAIDTKLDEEKPKIEKDRDEEIKNERAEVEQNLTNDEYLDKVKEYGIQTTDRGRNYYQDEKYNEEYKNKEFDDKYYFLHRYLDEYKNTGALGLMFTLGEERTISGTVFEDSNENEDIDENLGNGIIDEDEKNRASKVKVELIDAAFENGEYPDEPYPEAKLYQQYNTKNNNVEADLNSSKDEYKANGYIIVDAYTETDNNGYYEFVGVVPGVYKLRFTYSDGSQKMIDAKGEEIDDITSYDYKSTILNISEAGEYLRTPEEKTREEMIEATSDYLEAIKDKINHENLTDEDVKNRQLTEWYKEIYNNNSGIRYNIATDNFIGETKDKEENGKAEYNRSDFAKNEYRTEYTKSETTIITKDKDAKTDTPESMADVTPVMRSFSPYFSISIENDASDIRDVDYDPELNDGNNNGRNTKYGHRPVYENFNLGLIKITETKLSLDKIISNIKLTSSSGTVLAQGNPKETTNYITALDNLESNGSKYVRIEMGLDEIYGSQVEATYRIKISNISQYKDYIEYPTIKNEEGKEVDNKYFGYYFKYGDKGRNHRLSEQAYLVQTTVTEIIDELDQDYDLLDTVVRENVHHPKDSRPKDIEEAEKDGTAGNEWSIETEKNVTVTVKDDMLIFTGWSPIEKVADTQIRYKVNGLFREGMDLTYNNAAQITRMKVDYGQNLSTNYKWEQPGTTRLVITPDTGGNRRITYYVIGVVALVIIATGIIIIKKGVLRRND